MSPGPKNPRCKPRFITDMGEQLVVTDSDGKTLQLPRYAVWGDKGRGKPEVIETGHDLRQMQADHGVADGEIVSLRRTAAP